ncbi:hypothetical protein ACWGQT_07355 [Streptomyces yangpuensis]
MTELTGADLISAVDTSGEYDVGFYPEGRRPVEGLYRGRPLAELLERFTRERWTVHGTPARFKAQRDTGNGVHVYELNLLPATETAPQDLPPNRRDADKWRRSGSFQTQGVQ